MGFIYFILICVLGFFILCAIALISSEADNKKIKKEREAFADDCSSSILRKFSVQISCFYNYGNYSRTDCESPAAKYQLAAINEQICEKAESYPIPKAGIGAPALPHA